MATFAQHANLDLARFGEHCFKGDVASRYLGKYGESAALLATPAWTATKSDIVASAILDWARDNGASVYTHWFQPMGASGFRHGQTGQVHNTMIEFDANNVPRWKVRRGAARQRGARARRGAIRQRPLGGGGLALASRHAAPPAARAARRLVRSRRRAAHHAPPGHAARARHPPFRARVTRSTPA
jgi:hypothetical protein